MKKPERIVLHAGEINSLKERLSVSNLEDPDKHLLTGILQFYVWLQWALQETKLSVHRLRALFGFKTEKRCHLSDELDEAETSEEAQGTKPSDEFGQILSQKLQSIKEEETLLQKQKEKKRGHGRLGHKDYPGAVVVNQEHESLKPGDTCPKKCGGHLYSLEPKALVCLTGHALASATKYLLESLRCSRCGQVFTAKPKEGTLNRKYDEALKANLAIAKNYGGMPFYRLEMLQKMVGVPLPHPTQWQLIESLAEDIYPIYYELERLAAQGQLISHDDTKVRILDLMKENKEKVKKGEKDRTGMFTTAIVSQVDQQTIYLFLSGRRHSGENMTNILSKRCPELGLILRMADALSSNLSVEFITILCLCLAHGRRKFYEIYDYFPGECRVVIDAFALIYHYDAIAKREKMNPEKRLKHHQANSGPILKVLKEWMIQKLEGKETEPNSSLGKSFKYMLNHWEGLTRFLHVPGAIIDNNITERALKIPIRSRKNSLFYKTEHGAFVGSMLTSIIHTCVMAQENPVDYLIALQKNRRALFKSPKDWLPWIYKHTLNNQQSPPLTLRPAA